MLPHLFLHIKGQRGGQKDKREKERQGRSERLQGFKCNSNTPSLSSDLLVFLSSASASHVCLTVPPLTLSLFSFLCLFIFSPLCWLPSLRLSHFFLQSPYLISLSLYSKKWPMQQNKSLSSFSVNLYFFLSLLPNLCHSPSALLSTL